MAATAVETSPAVSPTQEQQPITTLSVADAPVDPDFGARAIIRLLGTDGSDAEDEDEPLEERVTETFLGKTSSTDVASFRAAIARDWKQTDSDAFQILVKLST